MQMRMVRCGIAAVACVLAFGARADPVVATHPRLMLTPAEKARLLGKVSANDASWVALKQRADTLATYTINQYKWANRGDAPQNTIYYTYQGEGWYDAAIP